MEYVIYSEKSSKRYHYFEDIKAARGWAVENMLDYGSEFKKKDGGRIYTLIIHKVTKKDDYLGVAGKVTITLGETPFIYTDKKTGTRYVTDMWGNAKPIKTKKKPAPFGL